jgi:hypothetical protein
MCGCRTKRLAFIRQISEKYNKHSEKKSEHISTKMGTVILETDKKKKQTNKQTNKNLFQIVYLYDLAKHQEIV